MHREIKKYFFQKSNKAYTDWFFPENKINLENGLIFISLTVTALSLVDYFYYFESYYNNLIPAQTKPFGIDIIFQLILLPIINFGLIFLAISQWNNTQKGKGTIFYFTIYNALKVTKEKKELAISV